MAKMTMKKYETSKMDKKMDTKKGMPKEGSKAEMKMDRMAIFKGMKKGK
jgi:hypothetical protein